MKPLFSPTTLKESPNASSPSGTSAVAVISLAPQPSAGALAPNQGITAPAFDEAQIDVLGNAAQEGLVSISTQLLRSVKATDAAEFGKGLNALVVTAKGLQTSGLAQSGVLGKLRGLMGNAKERLIANYATVEKQIDSLVAELDTKAMWHTKRIGDMDTLYLENAQYHEQLAQAVEAGTRAVTALRQHLDEQKVQELQDAFGAQKLADQQRVIDRLEKRISDLQRAMLLSKQAAPQIRLLQENARSLVQKFGDIKAVALPAWRNAAAQYVLQLEQGSAVALTEAIDDLTDSALKASADMLRKNSQDIARSRQRSVVGVETLAHIQTQLLGSLEDVQRIEREGAAQRATEAVRIQAMERELLQGFQQKNAA